MRYSHEIRVGLAVMLGLLIAVTGYIWLRGVGLGADLYYLRLNGVATIAEGNDVRLQGVKIGQVQDVQFDAATQRPILTLAVRRVNPAFKLLTSYAYTIQSAGIIGENYVDIRGTYRADQPSYLPNDKNEIIVCKAAGGLLAASEDASVALKDFHKVLTRLDVTLQRVNNGVLNSGNEVKLATALAGLAKLTQNASQAFGPAGVRIGFGDSKAQANLNTALQNAALASASAARAAQNIQLASGSSVELMSDLRNIVDQNKGETQHLLVSMDKAANSVAGITESLDFTLRQGGFRENAGIAFQSLRRAAENIEVASGGMRKLGEDEATSGDLQHTFAALRATSEALRDTTKIVRDAVTDKTNEGQLKDSLSALGATAKNLQDVTAGLKNIVGDPTVQQNIKSAASDLAGTLSATRASAERVNSILGGRRARPATGPGPAAGTATGTGGAAGAPGGLPPGSGISFTERHYYDQTGRNAAGATHDFGDLDFNSEFFGGPFRLGLDNIGEGNNLTAQTGRYLGAIGDLRYGLYRSKLGAGVDLHRGRLLFEGNLWDPNHNSWNAYGGLQVSQNLAVMLGRESVPGRHSNSVAVRINP